MQQYWEVKAQFEREVVLFRMGDFFEMFHSDAERAAPILGIALTQRNKKDVDSPKMCGVPHHSIAGPIAKLLSAGHKVAICDQIEDPALAKGLVKRAVTRVLTPGMVYDPDTLDQLSANYMASYDDQHLACADLTTGEAFLYEFGGELEREELLNLLSPVELVLTGKQIQKRGALHFKTMCSEFEVKFEGQDTARLRLNAYIEKMQGPAALQALSEYETRTRTSCLKISSLTLRHLEVFENSRGEKQGSLFEAINRTKTSSGARQLKSWLIHPLRNQQELEARQNEIRLWLEPGSSLKSFRQALAALGDVERRLSKVHSTTFNARDLLSIAQSVRVGQGLSQMHPRRPELAELKLVSTLAEKIERTLADELPLSVKEGGLIRLGAVVDLDRLIDLTQNGQKLLLELEMRERKATGISSLKVRYNSVFGFYIEITKAHSEKAPTHYRRKQTLTNAERFTTDELDQLEDRILSARAKRDQLEFEIFSQLKNEVIALATDIIKLARDWTRWDVLSSLAWLSLERNYTCPVFNSQGRLVLELCRHPVVEQVLNQSFVPNTVVLEPGEGILLTGPNMAGKSTLMRQVALIALLAQIGSYVPAQKATLPIFDELFTRIGASDFLNEGLSTFMVEMSETSAILSRVNSNCLVIMDEIGRGTSTYDGMSLAQAILEHLVSKPKPYLLFATHYHELASLAQIYPQLHNAHMSVADKNGKIDFLHTLKVGPANRSYGIHVAKLAGLPSQVTSRAASLLKGFEASGRGATQQLNLGEMPSDVREVEDEIPGWVKELGQMNLTELTPIEALNKLYEWQKSWQPEVS